MRRTALIAGLAAAIALPSLAIPQAASARSYCEQRAHDRRVGGTVIGAVAGGLLGNALSHGGGKTGGTIIGAGVGAVAGNNLARTSCDRPRAYYRGSAYHRYAARPYRYASTSACHYETRSYYDARGRLVSAPTQVCS